MAMIMHITQDYNCSHSKRIHGWPRGKCLGHNTSNTTSNTSNTTGLWSGNFSSLIPCDFHMWPLNQTIYRSNTVHTYLTKWRKKIWKQVIRYSKDQFTLLQKCQECTYKNEEHFWQLLYSQQVLQDLSFSRRCSEGFKSFGVLHHADWKFTIQLGTASNKTLYFIS